MKIFRLHIPVTLGVHWGGVCLGMCFLRKGKTTNTSFPYPPPVLEAIWEPEKTKRQKGFVFVVVSGVEVVNPWCILMCYTLAWLDLPRGDSHFFVGVWESWIIWVVSCTGTFHSVSFSSLLITPNAGYTREHCFMFVLSLNIYLL